MDASRFPIDFEALRKGDVIAPADVERITGVRRGDEERYRLALLGLRETVDRGLHRLGRVWTLRVDEGCIRVLTDQEASEYNHQRVNQGFKSVARCVRRQLAVDDTGFSEPHKLAHERNCFVNSRMLQAAKATRRQDLRALPHERTTPKQFGDG